MKQVHLLRRGFSYVELLVAVVLLGIVSASAIATWNLSSRFPANKRVTEMATYIGVQELERMKAEKYLTLTTTVRVQYYDKYGAQVGSAATNGYKAKAWASTLINRDGTTNSEDLLEVQVEVWDNNETNLYGSIRTLLTFGGM